MMDPGEMAVFPRDSLYAYQQAVKRIVTCRHGSLQADEMDKMHKPFWQYKFYLYYSKNTQIYLSLYPIYNKVRTKKSRPDYQSLGNIKTCI